MNKLQQWLIDTANSVWTGWYSTEGHRPPIHCKEWPPMIFEAGVSFPCIPQMSCSKKYPTEYSHICIESPTPIPMLSKYLIGDYNFGCGYHQVYTYSYGFVPIDIAQKLLRERRGKLVYE